jgi:hypothetical protein
MKPLRLLMIVTAACCACVPFAIAQPAPLPPSLVPSAAAIAPFYDLRRLPSTRGTASRDMLAPRGGVDGLILADGTEVHFPPHLSTQLVYTIKPADTVTIRRLNPQNAPLAAAIAIITGATGNQTAALGQDLDRGATQAVSGQGRALMSRHGPRGERNVAGGQHDPASAAA